MEADPENFKFPEGESLNELEKRAHKFYDEIIRKHPNETVLLIAHGSFLSMFFFIIANEPVNDKKRSRLKNAEPIILEINNA